MGVLEGQDEGAVVGGGIQRLGDCDQLDVHSSMPMLRLIHLMR